MDSAELDDPRDSGLELPKGLADLVDSMGLEDSKGLVHSGDSMGLAGLVDSKEFVVVSVVLVAADSTKYKYIIEIDVII